MGSRIHNQNHHKNPCASLSTNKIFLPTLCRLSIKDTPVAPQPTTTRTRLCPKNTDPRSPTISCMGQVKRHPSAVKHHHQILFSGNNKCVATLAHHRRRRRRQSPPKLGSGDENNKCGAVVPLLNLAELDPPLPVIKKLQPPQPSVSLWKRRSREHHGHLADIQIPTFHSIQTSTDPQLSV